MVKDNSGFLPPWPGFFSPIFYKTAPMPCPYLDGQDEQRILTELPDGPMATALFNSLSQAGFRRSHRLLYLPDCPNCRACVPVRIIAAGFSPNRSLSKALRRASILRREIVPAEPTAEQYTLFRAYQDRRHTGGDMGQMSWSDYAAMVGQSSVDTRLLEARMPDGTLVGCCLFDTIRDGLSAVYSFFADPLPGVGLGSVLVHDLVQQTLSEQREYVYLGFWIEECAKMAYKIKFQPLERLTRRGWVPLPPPNP